MTGTAEVVRTTRATEPLTITYAAIVAGRAALLWLLIVTPVWNPVVSRASSARIYVSHSVIVAIMALGLGLRVFDRRIVARQIVARLMVALAAVGLAICFFLVQYMATPSASLKTVVAWSARPLQPLLLAAAVTGLVNTPAVLRWLRIALGGATLGIALGLIGWLVPAIDLTEISRPKGDVLAIAGNVRRAVGGFVYPNNLGAFAMYTSLGGLWLYLFDSDTRGRLLGVVAFLMGPAALTASGNRASALGWVLAVGALCALVFLQSVRARSRQIGGSPAELERPAELGRPAEVGKLCVLGVVCALTVAATFGLSNYATVENGEQGAVVTGTFTESRLDLEGSISLRRQMWRAAWNDFRDSPVVGSGVNEDRIDSLWLLYLGSSGLVGVTLLVALGVVCWFSPGVLARSGPASLLRITLLFAMGVVGVLQDTLGQPLASWLPGVILGLIVVGLSTPAEPSTDVSRGARSDTTLLAQ